MTSHTCLFKIAGDVIDLRTVASRKVLGSNPIKLMRDFSALAGSYPELGVLCAQWEGWNHTAELHPLHGCVLRVLL